ncbi:DUF3224 domain-containing protein [Paucibacter sp. APW11]|uniref:DUF3224 domain-containing protein n=1 Tax=Roseateles aquae TaxID=3077235 RepID=A0ABU3PBR0_9BURK|nr:DUF3224 domain-containing protein [Paucibacter sp. APW11]MDT9000002.1 DUF3224 domain-containing protein [Paucibacter sp. APW11]
MNASASPTTQTTHTARGQFSVKIGVPEAMAVPEGATPMFRRSLDKVYEGDLQASARGEMLAAGQPQTGSAAYTALESIHGTLQGRNGSFALAHLGLMKAGSQDLRIAIAPGSGQGELTGISGELLLRIEAGVHFYELNYRFADGR